MSRAPTGLRARSIHPVAWWLWATGLAVAAIKTTNPFLLLLIASVVVFVVAFRRPDAPWSRSLSFFLKIGVVVIVIRLVVVIVFGQRGTPGLVLFTLPAASLPGNEGLSIGGPVTLEAMLVGLVSGLRLAVIVLCFGAANSMASPYRLLRCLPAVLYEAGVAVTVALSFAPELVLTLASVREARRLRGRPARGIAGVRGIAVPVLEGALDRSVQLAASMDARGYGRRTVAGKGRRLASWATASGLLLAIVGTYGVLDSGSLFGLGPPLLALAVALIALGLVSGSRRLLRTRYRPEPWRLAECFVAASGLAALGAFALAEALGTAGLAVGFPPLALPPLPLLPVTGVIAALVPIVVTSPSAPAARSAAAGAVAPAGAGEAARVAVQTGGGTA